jgi:hypothetical protein
VTYVNFDDAFPEDDRVFGLTDKAFRLHVAAWCTCSRNLTDGIVSMPRLEALLAQTKATVRHANELVAVGLWRPLGAGETLEIEGKVVVSLQKAYYLNGYLNLNRSKEQVEALIQARREAGRRGGVAKALASATASALAKSYPDTDTEKTVVAREGAGVRAGAMDGALEVGPDDIPPDDEPGSAGARNNGKRRVAAAAREVV